MTGLSLLVTLLMDILSKVRWTLPPPSKIYVITSSIKRVRGNKKSSIYSLQDAEKAGTSEFEKSSQWSQVFSGLNVLLSGAIMMAYFAGVMIIL